VLAEIPNTSGGREAKLAEEILARFGERPLPMATLDGRNFTLSGSRFNLQRILGHSLERMSGPVCTCALCPAPKPCPCESSGYDSWLSWLPWVKKRWPCTKEDRAHCKPCPVIPWTEKTCSRVKACTPYPPCLNCGDGSSCDDDFTHHYYDG